MPTTIRFPKVCGVYAFERLLLEQLAPLAKEPAAEVYLDLSSTSWIGLLETTLLYDVTSQLVVDGHAVTINLANQEDLSVANFFSRIGLARALQELGAIVHGYHPSGSQLAVSAFQRFSTRDELASYEAAISDAETRQRVLGGGNDISVIATGDFREIVLHELGENAFLHGKGAAARYLIREGRLRRSPDDFAFVPDQEFVEIVMSDAGPGLVNRLRPKLQNDWEPPSTNNADLSLGSRTCAFALEFSATSDSDARRERLQQQLNSTDDFADVIPTGLFYVASLVRHYHGQLIIRTGNTFFMMDCTGAGLAVLRENPLKRQGAKVRGTHVLIRVPKQVRFRPLVHASKFVQPHDPFIESAHHTPILLAELWQQAKEDPAAFLVRMESMVEGFFGTKHSGRGRVLVLLADGFQPDTKTAAWILTWLGAIPRRSTSLVVCGLAEELFDAALEQSRRIAAIRKGEHTHTSGRRFHAWQPYHICSSRTDQAMLFGDTVSSTTISLAIRSIYQSGLRQVLEAMIGEAPVKHLEREGRYYLIEGKYYTKRFYEVRQLTSKNRNPVGAGLVAAYMKTLLLQHKIAAVYCISESLNDVVVALAELVPTIKFHQSSAGTTFLPVAIAVAAGSPIAILTDVVCTGSQFLGFLRRAPRIEDIRLITLVDARNVAFKKYFTAEGPERAHTVPIYSILQTEIRPIEDLPYTDDPDILIIDKQTHGPTPKVDLSNIHVGPSEVIEASTASDALYQGHIVVDDVHYVDLIILPRLLAALESELSSSWSSMLQAMAESGIDAKHTSVFYFSEERGWEHLVERFMATRGVAECRSIDRARLEAPPAQLESSIRGRAVLLILPVIASGETLRQCLEYFSRIKSPSGSGESRPPELFVCVAMGRATASELSFYQGIRRFKNCKVRMEVMSYLPLPAYRGARACPICQLLQTVRGNATRLRNRATSDLVEHASRVFQEIRVTFKHGEPLASDERPIASGTRATLRSLFNEAGRDVLRRKELAELLDHEANKKSFFEMIGSHTDAGDFSTNILEERLYTRFTPLHDFALDMLRNSNGRGLSVLVLLGLHIVFPDDLENSMKSLALRACRTGDLQQLADLLFMTMTEPRKYGVLFSVGVLAATYEGAVQALPGDLARELTSHHIWSDVSTATAIDSFESMLWLLRRSTDWGTGIERLRAYLHLPEVDRRELVDRFRDFELKGVNTVLRHMAAIEAADDTDGLLTAIIAEEVDPRPFTNLILAHTDAIRDLLASPAIVAGEVATKLASLDTAGKALLKASENLFTNPISALIEAEAVLAQGVMWPRLCPSRFRLEATVAAGQPGILFGLSDLKACIFAILENVSDHIAGTVESREPESALLWASFDFLGFDPACGRAILEVRDNVPYKRALKPTGGLKKAEANCAKYGASVDFAPEPRGKPNLRMRFYFRIDFSRRSA